MAVFQKRHYEALAHIMQRCKPGDGYARELVNWTHIRNEMVETFVRDNGRFDVARFERACEPGANVRARS